MASSTLQTSSKVAVIIVASFIISINFTGSYAHAQDSQIETANEETGLIGVNCTTRNQDTQCKSRETGLGCYYKKCACLVDTKSPVFGGNINVISEWNDALGRCLALPGSLCDLEGRVLLCRGKLECRKADGDFGKLPDSSTGFGVGKCDAAAVGASAVLVAIIMAWAISKVSF